MQPTPPPIAVFLAFRSCPHAGVMTFSRPLLFNCCALLREVSNRSKPPGNSWCFTGLPHHSFCGGALTGIRWLSTSNTVRTEIGLNAAQRDVLKGVPEDHRLEVARAIHLAEKAENDWKTYHTNFMPPPVAADILKALEKLAYVVGLKWGGYPMAERCRIVIGREEMLEGLENPAAIGEVAAVKVSGSFLFENATHRDFLGAILNTGIKREVVGDIILEEETGAIVMTTPQMADYLEIALHKVRNVNVTAQRIPLTKVNVRPAKVKTIRTTEKSMRIDAVASRGFRLSREKMQKLVREGDVRVNWTTYPRNTSTVKEGDVISCKGRGRIEIKTVGKTKSGRYAIELLHYC